MNIDYNTTTLFEIYSRSIKEFNDKIAFATVGKDTLTYGEFGNKVDDLSGLLFSQGVKKGDKVALLASNMPNWPVAYFAITVCGAIVVPILADFTAFEIANILEHSEAKAIILSSKLQYKISPQIKEKIELIIGIEDLGLIKSTENAIKADISRLHPQDIAAVIYTSGTSGASKGVMLTHSNLVSQIKMSYDFFNIFPDDIFLSILPLSHAYECSIGMLFPFACGSSVVYLDGAPTPSLLMPALKEVKPSIMLSVPLIVEKIYKIKIRPMFTKNFLLRLVYSVSFIRRALHKVAGKKLLETFGGNLRFFGIGGSRIDGVVEHFLADAGFPYAIGYGLTETSPLIAAAPPGRVKWQSTGPALHGIDLKILNPNQKNIGEIVVKGPNVMAGYYKDKKTTDDAFTADGWFRTKDSGYIDKYGNLFVKGRKDNMVLGPNGENIYPEDIESIINEFDLVLESLVIEKSGRLIAKVHFNYDEIKNSDGIFGEENTNFREKIAKIKQELMVYVNDRVNKSSKISEIIEQTAPFEKTATQKIKRYLYS